MIFFSQGSQLMHQFWTEPSYFEDHTKHGSHWTENGLRIIWPTREAKHIIIIIFERNRPDSTSLAQPRYLEEVMKHKSHDWNGLSFLTVWLARKTGNIYLIFHTIIRTLIHVAGAIALWGPHETDKSRYWNFSHSPRTARHYLFTLSIEELSIATSVPYF